MRRVFASRTPSSRQSPEFSQGATPGFYFGYVMSTPTIEEIRMTFFNYNKPSQQILSDLIFATNGFRLPATGVTYGTPVAVPGPAGFYSYLNTGIEVSIPYAPGVQNYGKQTFFYSRLNLGNAAPVTGATPIVVASYPTDTYTLLPQINAYYGLQLGQDDVLNTVYADNTVDFLITAAPGSLVWTPATALDVTTVVTGATGTGGHGTGTAVGWTGLGQGSSGVAPITGDGTSGSGGSGSGGSGGSGSGSGSGSGGGTSGSDGVDPNVEPDFEPNGESGVCDLSETGGTSGTATDGQSAS